MPKLPILKDKELIKILKKLGFTQHRQKSTSHLIMKHSDGRRVVIPIHPGKDIPKGTLLSIIRSTKIAKENFFN